MGVTDAAHADLHAAWHAHGGGSAKPKRLSYLEGGFCHQLARAPSALLIFQQLFITMSARGMANVLPMCACDDAVCGVCIRSARLLRSPALQHGSGGLAAVRDL